jgi:hypothetical protein
LVVVVHSFFGEKRTSDPAKLHLHYTVIIIIHERKMKHIYYGIILMTVFVSAFSKTSVVAVCEVLGT